MLPLVLFRKGDAWKRTGYHCGRSLLALFFAAVQDGACGEGARPSLPISMHPVTQNVVPPSTSSLTSLPYTARNLPIPNLRLEQSEALPQSERRLQYLIKSRRLLTAVASLPGLSVDGLSVDTPLYLDDIVIVRRTMDDLQVALNTFDDAMRTVVSHWCNNTAMPSFFEDLCSLFHDQVADVQTRTDDTAS